MIEGRASIDPKDHSLAVKRNNREGEYGRWRWEIRRVGRRSSPVLSSDYSFTTVSSAKQSGNTALIGVKAEY